MAYQGRVKSAGDSGKCPILLPPVTEGLVREGSEMHVDSGKLSLLPIHALSGCLFSLSNYPGDVQEILHVFLQELDDLRKNKSLTCFRNIEVDESNILAWKGLIVPVSETDSITIDDVV